MSTAIRIENLSKKYRLGVINNGTLWKDFQTWMALKTGKEDPHSRIGEDRYASTEDYFWALKDLSFDIKQGDRVGIIGKNGAGKSTLLKILSRVTAPTEGTIKVNGKIASLLEVGTGFHGELTGRENIYLNGAILGMKKRQIDRKLDEIIAFSEIEHHIDTPVKRYSSGMYVRLAFAVAAHLDSDILIADEVLAVGDASFQKKALGKMQDLSTGEGRTVLFVSHNMASVKQLCNSGIILEKGRVGFSGNIDDSINRYLANNEAVKRTEWNEMIGDSSLLLHSAKLTHKGDSVLLDIEYEILIPGDNYVFSVLIFNTNGIQLAVATASDYADDLQYRKMISKGKHKIQLTIDTSIFATGEYYIEFDFAIHNVKRIVPSDVRLFFEVLDPQNHRHKSGSRENIIEPGWKWEFQ